MKTKNKKVVAVLGSTGMLGRMVTDVLKQDESIEVIEFNHHDFNAEIITANGLKVWLEEADYIINCIGMINKNIDENDSESIQRAIEVNAQFPRELEKLKIPTIQIATDCAGEPDTYGMTKMLGEVRGENFANIRCSIIGPGNKTGLLDWFLEQKECQGYMHHLWNGVTTLAFARMCLGLIKSDKDVEFYDQVNFTPADWECKAGILKKIGRYFNHSISITATFDPDAIVDRRISSSPQAILLWKMAGYEDRPTIEYLVQELANYLEGRTWNGKRYL
jgi:dTDP-4-dehydrorhamnose reductase